MVVLTCGFLLHIYQPYMHGMTCSQQQLSWLSWQSAALKLRCRGVGIIFFEDSTRVKFSSQIIECQWQYYSYY